MASIDVHKQTGPRAMAQAVRAMADHLLFAIIYIFISFLRFFKISIKLGNIVLQYSWIFDIFQEFSQKIQQSGI